MRALVVGGTGPTGPFLVAGLRDRGYKVTILHRGTHEIDEIPDDVEHIHTDPHFRETLSQALESRSFDLCVASYGRVRYVAEVMAGRTGRFIAASGITYYRAAADPLLVFPPGGASPLREEDMRPSVEENRFCYMIGHSEDEVRRFHRDATIFRYPYVYGPHQVSPREWSIIRRINDGRPFLILPEGGLMMMTHGYAGNIAAAVLAAVDQPDIAAGQSYNCGDERQFNLRQISQIIADEMGYEIELLTVPMPVAGAARPMVYGGRTEHMLTDIYKLRNELGYRDAIDSEAAIRKTVHWYLANPPAPGGAIERALGDPFDYAAEDRLAAVIRDAHARMAALDTGEIERVHAYAHPKKPGEQDHRGR